MPEHFQITLLRHGESLGNADRRVQGQAEFPLTDLGREETRRLLARWREEDVRFDAILSSPLERARETGQILAEGLEIPLEICPEWMERNAGKMQGLPRNEANFQYPRPDFFNPYTPMAVTGEGDWELYLRAGRALQKLLSRPPGKYLVVTHGGILNQTIAAIIGVTPHANGTGPRFFMNNTGFARFIYYPQTHVWLVLGLNDHSHLKGLTPEETFEG